MGGHRLGVLHRRVEIATRSLPEGASEARACVEDDFHHFRLWMRARFGMVVNIKTWALRNRDDAFQIDPSWRAMLEPPQEAKADEKATELRTDAALPGVVLPKVTMVMQNGASGCAMIDGKLIQVGSMTTGGVTLLGVGQRAVRLLVDGVEVEIPVVDSGSPEDR